MVELKILHLSSTGNHNRDMIEVDTADHKRGSYRPDGFARKIKWLWPTWEWGLEVLLVDYHI